VSEKKWATGPSCIRKRSTSYKIGTLVVRRVVKGLSGSDRLLLVSYQTQTVIRQSIGYFNLFTVNWQFLFIVFFFFNSIQFLQIEIKAARKIQTLFLGTTLSVILDIDINLSVVLSATVAVSYTLVGGMFSVAYTDVIQIAFIFGGLWLAIPFMWTAQGVNLSHLSTEDWTGTG
jgi:Na+/pantothenate symporter